MTKFEKILRERKSRISLFASISNKSYNGITYAIDKWNELAERIQIKYTASMKELGWVNKNTTYQELFSNIENE